MSEKIAVFAGSFDPITIGHEDLVNRACSMFDKIVVAVGTNGDKHGLFPVEKRIEWIAKTFDDNPQVSVSSYDGLTIDFCKSIGAKFLLRGIRNAIDLVYEQQIADVNRRLDDQIETVFLLTRPEYADVSSSTVRELLKYGKNIDSLVPHKVK